MFRYNTDDNVFEYYNGTAWKQSTTEFTVVQTEAFSGNGVITDFTINPNLTTASCIVSINGVVQLPNTAYSVSGTTLTFTEAPADGDNIEVREIVTTTSVNALTDADDDTKIQVEESADEDIIRFDVGGTEIMRLTGSALLPSTDSVYDLGSASNKWGDLYLSGTTLRLGTLQLKDNGSNGLVVLQSDGTTPANVIGDVKPGNIQLAVTGDNEIDTSSGNLTIDSAGGTVTVDDNLTVTGDLTVNGTLTTINTTDLVVADKNITIADGAADAAAANGAGLTVDGANATITYASGTDTWDFNKTVKGTFSGNITGNVTGDVTGNADTATTLATARTIELSGDVSGSASFDGSANVTITATIADDSHNHTIANVDGLQAALDLKAPLASPALTGTPTAPTASAATNNTQVATTAYVTTAIDNLIGGAPGALDTLNELAAAINDDASYASTVTTALGTKVDTTSAQALGSAANVLTISGNTITLARGDSSTDTVSLTLGTNTDGNYVAAGATSGNGISGSVSSEGGTFTVTSNATSDNTASTIVFRDGSGNFSAGTITATATSAQYADLAERYTSDAIYEPGTVVSFGGDAEVTMATESMDSRIAGVVSTNPGFLMNEGLEGTNVAVALTGRVPVKVTGTIRKGDMLVSAGEGYAKAEANPRLGSVIGKALEDFNGVSGIIEVVVGRL